MKIEELLDEFDFELLKKNIIVIKSEICDDLVIIFQKAMAILAIWGNPDITIYIKSNGGNTKASLDIYDMISNYPGKTTGIAIGFAKSAAVTILQACNKRKSYAHSSFLIHYIVLSNISLVTLIKKKKLKALIKDSKKSHKRVENILVEKTGLSRKKIRSECLKDYEITAKKAFKLGLIDEIITGEQEKEHE